LGKKYTILDRYFLSKLHKEGSKNLIYL
jgi:hypothetical protein